MKVLVIGAAGQLARSLQEAARPDSIEVVAAGRPELDLADRCSIEQIFESVAPDLVVNAAAYTAVDKAESEPELAFAVNAVGPGILAELCEQGHMPFIHISTDYVFDGRKAEPYVETDPVAPLGIYGQSKYEGEQRVASACSRHLILRSAWVYSPFGQNFVKTMLRLGNECAELSIVDDQTGNPTYAPHLAKLVLGLLSHLASQSEMSDIWGIYHVSAQGEASWFDLAVEVFRHSAKLGGPSPQLKPIPTSDYPTPAKRPVNSRLNSEKLQHRFGVSVADWHDGVKNCVERLIT